MPFTGDMMAPQSPVAENAEQIDTAPLSTAHAGGSCSPDDQDPWSEPSRVVARPAALAGTEDQQSAEHLYRRYQRYVGSVGRNVLGHGPELDDLIQDVFLVALQGIHTLRDPTRLRGWLATVTRRLAQKRYWQKSTHLIPVDDETTATEEPSPESQALRTAAFQAVQSLPEDLRTPWTLRHVDGLSLQSIASACDCSMSTVQRRLTLASERLSSRTNR